MNRRLHLRRARTNANANAKTTNAADPSASRASVDAEAARRTEALLARLPAREWRVLSDVDRRHGVEHVLVGPGGVFAIVSRKPAGSGARVRDGMLWLRDGGDARADRSGAAINRRALDAARALQREIRVRTGRGPAVHAVVVLWCEFPQGVAESSRVVFVHGRDLAGWLTHRARELDGPGCAEIAVALEAIAHDEPPVRHLPRPRLPHSPGTRRRAA
jgi:hypothetical protein